MMILLWSLLLPTLGQHDDATRQSRAVRQAKQAPITFRTLLIIKRRVDLDQAPFLPVQNELSDEDIRAVSGAFKDHTAYWVDQLTSGRVSWNGEVVISDQPLRSVNGDRSCAACGGINVRTEIDQYAPVGRYDGVFVYFKHIDDASGYTLPRAFGLSIGPNPDANYAGQTCINWAPIQLWTRDSETTEIFLHEWLHQLEAFYESRGVKLPRGRLHGAQEHGYKSEPGFKKWYRAFLNAEVEEDGRPLGLGEAAWRLGTIRDAATKLPEPKHSPVPVTRPSPKAAASARLAPGFITVARRRQNLLKNASFDKQTVAPWSAWSWRKNDRAASQDNEHPRHGKACIQLNSNEPDDTFVAQRVTVKPFTNYLLSGWIRTEGVQIVEKGGSLGAHLQVSSGETSHSFAGTNDWQYAVVLFYSADRKEIEVQARLGGNASTTEGLASFDDLCLIEIPAGAQTRTR